MSRHIVNFTIQVHKATRIWQFQAPTIENRKIEEKKKPEELKMTG
uniref:Uncharacterized protein n=1 Tax=Rhizophora mucronata TaxID=61149 RepID=A0A2P2MJ30_RHIMU